MSGYIYFIRSGESDWIKIGYAKNVKHRLSHLQVGSAEVLSIVVTLPGTIEQERQLHQALLFQKNTKKRGEWFLENHAVKLTLQMVKHDYTVERILDALSAYRLVLDIMEECSRLSAVIKWRLDHEPNPQGRLRELDTRFDNARRLLSDLLGGNGDLVPIEPKHRRATA